MGIPRIEPYEPLPATESSANLVDWAVDPDRAVLLIHDMQRYFVRPFSEAMRRRLLENIVALREHCRAAGIPVAYTAQPGGMTEEQRGLLKDFWGMGMGTDPADRDVVPELTPGPDDWRFTKWRYSAFARSNLLDRMRDHARDQLVICGVYAHVGVLMTAVDAFTHDIQPFIVADAVGDFSADYHHMAMRFAAERCAAVRATKELLI